MSVSRLTGTAFCRAFMEQVVSDLHVIAEQTTKLLRVGPQEKWEAELGKNILTLRSLPLTEEHIAALESAFQQVQENILGALFALIDGSAQPPGWPDEIRLVNMDTGEVICPDGLEWAFGLALAEYRDRSMAPGQA